MNKKRVKIDRSMSEDRIIEQYDVSLSTARRSKERGWLCQHWRRDDSERADNRSQQLFTGLMADPGIKQSGWECLPLYTINDICQGKSTLRVGQWQSFVDEYIDLTGLLDKFLSMRLYDEKRRMLHLICENKRIVKSNFFDNRKMIDRLQKGINVYRDEFEDCRRTIIEFKEKYPIQ